MVHSSLQASASKSMSKSILFINRDYLQRIKVLPSDASFADFRAARQKLMWITHTRPDILCAVNRATQVTEALFGQESIQALNKIARHAHKHPLRGLRYSKLDIATLHLRAYSDSSFANNYDQTTQLGYIVMLCDANEKMLYNKLCKL